MARRGPGRTPHSDPPQRKELSLPQSLVAEVELILYDPSLQKVQYSAFSKLVERLLREWLEKEKGLRPR